MPKDSHQDSRMARVGELERVLGAAWGWSHHRTTLHFCRRCKHRDSPLEWSTQVCHCTARMWHRTRDSCGRTQSKCLMGPGQELDQELAWGSMVLVVC